MPYLWRLIVSYSYADKAHLESDEPFYVAAASISEAVEIALKEASRIEHDCDFPAGQKMMVVAAELVSWYVLSGQQSNEMEKS